MNPHLSKRTVLKGGVALALLPRAPALAALADRDIVADHVSGIDVLTRDGRSMTVGELHSLPGLDPAVRRFLLDELRNATETRFR